jgi:hypothetical protein
LQERADAAPLVLGLVCRHSHLGGNLQAVCSLLRVSKAVQQAVLDACSGPGNSQLQLRLTGFGVWSPSRVPSTDLQLLQRLSFQVKWLSKFGRLVLSMALSANPRLHAADEALMCVGVRPPVQMQQLSLGGLYPLANPSAVLQQLDASHITEMTVGIRAAHAAARFKSALAQLQSLRSLKVHSMPLKVGSTVFWDVPKDACLGALAPLTQLAELSLTELHAAGTLGLLVHLPSSLVSIKL